MWKVDSLEKALMLGGIGGRRRRERQRMRWLDGITDWWTWIWVNSGIWWRTGRHGMLWFMGSQRVGHDWAPELNWILHCVYVPQLSYPFICWWTSRLLSCPGYYKQCCDEHWGTQVSFNSGFLGVYAQKWDCWVVWQFYFQFLKESPHCSPYWLYWFAFPPTVWECFIFSTPSLAFIACRLFDSSHSDWREMVPHCGFDLHFSDKEWCWACFHGFVSHLYVFFGEMSV